MTTDPIQPGETNIPVPGTYPEVTPLPEKQEPEIPQEAPATDVPLEMPDVVPDEQPMIAPSPGEVPGPGNPAV